MATAPLIALESGGKAPVINYNVPEPTSYSGKNFLELIFDEAFFKDEYREAPDVEPVILKDKPYDEVIKVVEEGLRTGFADRRYFPATSLSRRTATSTPSAIASKEPAAKATTVEEGKTGALRRRTSSPRTTARKVKAAPTTTGSTSGGSAGSGGGTSSGGSTSAESSSPPKTATPLDANLIASELQAGRQLQFYTNLFGTQDYTFTSPPQDPVPRILLVETYRLSSYLGAYGAGRVLKTFTLLPGEKTTISVNTYTRSSTTSAQASSVLDSFTEESATELETNIASEQSSQESYEKSFEYYADAEAQASWGWGSAKVSGGVSGSTNSGREEFAKNMSSATSRQAASASAKRDVQINTSYEVSTETGEETSTVREIQNINVSRTLNFVFRQMNQEFLTFLHLVDVRVAFFNGFADSRIEVPLPELDSLLETVLVDDAAVRQEVKDNILFALTHIRDHSGNMVGDFVVERTYDEPSGTSSFWHVNTGKVSTYVDPVTGTSVDLPGVLLKADKHVLRTEGVIVESLLGQGEALDEYNKDLQSLAVAQRRAENTALSLQNERERLAQKMVTDGDAVRGDIFATVFPPATSAGEGAEDEEDGS